MTLTAAYFAGELLIPGVTGSTYAEVSNLALLNRTILKHEKKFLEKLLGEDLYAAYAAAMLLSPTSGVWYDLDQQIYTSQTSGDITIYSSPAANYVYFQFWKTASSMTSTLGELASKAENADVVSIGHKMVAAWNEMVDLVDEIREWLDDNADDYPLWGTEEVEVFTKVTVYGC